MERTFVMIKPDGVRRRLVGEIIRRFETRGFNIVALKMLTPSRELAEKHYAVHEGKPFYESLAEFITSGPVVAMVLEADDAVRLVRNMMGALKPADAMPGTIRATEQPFYPGWRYSQPGLCSRQSKRRMPGWCAGCWLRSSSWAFSHTGISVVTTNGGGVSPSGRWWPAF